MDALIGLMVLAIVVGFAAYATRNREKLYKWLNKPAEDYYASTFYRRLKLQRRMDDAQGELDFIAKQEEEKTEPGE